MVFIFIHLMLPTIILARITIKLKGNFDPSLSGMDVVYQGDVIDVISDEERQTFKLTDDNIKHGFKVKFGNRPDDVYVTSPGIVGHLFHTHNWTQVLRILKPVDAKILKVTTKPKLVIQEIFQNKNRLAATYDVAISYVVKSITSSSWNVDGELTVDEDIDYTFKIGLLNRGGAISLSYTSSWGTNINLKQTIDLGSASSAEVRLQPGQTITANLRALKGTIKIEVVYEASLSGNVVGSYDTLYQDRQFWGLDVNTVLSAMNLQSKIRFKEVMDISLYGCSEIVVTDKVDADRAIRLDL